MEYGSVGGRGPCPKHRFGGRRGKPTADLTPKKTDPTRIRNGNATHVLVGSCTLAKSGGPRKVARARQPAPASKPNSVLSARFELSDGRSSLARRRWPPPRAARRAAFDPLCTARRLRLPPRRGTAPARAAPQG